MKKISLILLGLVLVTSCASRNPQAHSSDKSISITTRSLVHRLLRTAEKYKGTPYLYGGTTKKGVDCSGFIYQVFSEHGISFPRISRHQAKKGKKVAKRNIKKGDLVYFSTSRRGGVSHVGLVYHIKGEEIFFIHSSSSKGVIISSLDNKYWKKAFLFAKRVL